MYTTPTRCFLNLKFHLGSIFRDWLTQSTINNCEKSCLNKVVDHPCIQTNYRYTTIFDLSVNESTALLGGGCERTCVRKC